MIREAAAPSVRNEEFAAVCVPCGFTKAGFKGSGIFYKYL